MIAATLTAVILAATPLLPRYSPFAQAPLPEKLMVPVEGVEARQLADTYGDARGSMGKHEAIDIPAPKGTPVLAVADGHVAKLFLSKPGGITIYQFDRSGTVAYYYAHLERYAPGLDEGDKVKRGEVIGYVGTTGNAPPAAPHLHFAVFMLGPAKRWWEGTAVNPYPLLTGQ
jgi:murein DD-endopeptidase MepM/ murein hydrolase activator NlpD